MQKTAHSKRVKYEAWLGGKCNPLEIVQKIKIKPKITNGICTNQNSS